MDLLRISENYPVSLNQVSKPSTCEILSLDIAFGGLAFTLAVNTNDPL